MVAEAMYRQIFEDLRARIEDGELAPGSQLPTEIELMAKYNASRNTVRDAVKLLTTRRLVETRPGQGTFVIEIINPFVSTLTGDPEAGGGEEDVYIAEVTAGGRVPKVSPPRVEIQQARTAVADSLRLPLGSSVISRHQQRFIDETPWSLQTTFYPMKLAEMGARKLLEAQDIDGGAVNYLAQACGIQQAGYRDSISVRAPNQSETAFFRLPADGRVQVFVVYRVGFDKDGGRIRLTITVYPADRNRFRINVGKVPQPSAALAGRPGKPSGSK